MASSKAYLEFVLDQLSGLDGISYRPMMGEFLLYCRGRLLGGVYDDRLLLKPTKAALRVLEESAAAWGRDIPYDGAKEMLLVDNLDSKPFLQTLLDALHADLPAPKRKPHVQRP